MRMSGGKKGKIRLFSINFKKQTNAYEGDFLAFRNEDVYIFFTLFTEIKRKREWKRLFRLSTPTKIGT